MFVTNWLENWIRKWRHDLNWINKWRHGLNWINKWRHELNPSSAANGFSASKDLPLLLEYRKVHYRIHNSPPPVLTWVGLAQSTPFPSLYLVSSLITFANSLLGLPNLFSFKFSYSDIYVYIFPSFLLYEMPIWLPLTPSPRQGMIIVLQVCTVHQWRLKHFIIQQMH